jgi:hypothetical protein
MTFVTPLSGERHLAYSGIWRVWIARNKPDLYLAAERISGDLKASVHCPWPPHADYRRHLVIPREARGEVAKALKKDSGPHLLQWPGYTIGPDSTLEFRIIFRGQSLARNGFAVSGATELLPIPSENEAIEVAVLLGPATPMADYPRHQNISTHLLREGRLSNGQRIWIVYCRTAFDTVSPPRQHLVTPAKHYEDPTVDLTKISSLRGALFGVQDDGHLAFLDVRATASRKEAEAPLPSMLMATPLPASAPVKVWPVNCEPWSVLNISGLP